MAVIDTIETLGQLYKELDSLFGDISKICKQCKEEDCHGYLWLMPKEVGPLYEKDIEIMEINKDVCFINPFSGENVTINVEAFKPQCPCYQDRKCSIYNDRPLVCRMYPLNFIKKGATVYLVLHLDCLYSKNVAGDSDFINRAIKLFSSLSPQLKEEIKETFEKVEDLSIYPNGPNNFMQCSIIWDNQE